MTRAQSRSQRRNGCGEGSPSWVEPVSAPKGERTTSYEGIPSQCVADTTECCASSAMPARLLEAAKQARGEGLVTTSEYNKLEREPS